MRASIRATEKYIALVVLVLSFSAFSVSAQTTPIYSDPTGSQAIAQPPGTGIGIGGTNTTAGYPNLFSLGLTDTGDGSGPTMVSQGLNCFGQGFSFGNNGTSAEGWSGCNATTSFLFSAASGIDHLRSDVFTHTAQGDTALQYSYLTTFGGATASSDEGVTPVVIQSHQIDYMTGVLSGVSPAGAPRGYSPLSTGVIYLAPFTLVPYTTDIASITVALQTTPAGQPLQFVLVTPQGGNQYRIDSIINVSTHATVYPDTQTFTSADFGTGVMATQGQWIGMYVPGSSSITPFTDSVQQISYTGAPMVSTTPVTFTAGGSGGVSIQVTMAAPQTGATGLVATDFGCSGYGYCQAVAGEAFAQGGILLDTSQGGSTASIGAYAGPAGPDGPNSLSYTLTSGSVAVSTAWGNLDPTSCSYPGFVGPWQDYKSIKCNVNLAITPASPGNFGTTADTGADICLSGPFQEEAAVTDVATVSSGVQAITFNSRYAWDPANGNQTLVMQGGVCGQSIVATSTMPTWPVAYALVGATTPTQVYFSNCLTGVCNGTAGLSNILNRDSSSPLSVTFYPSAFITGTLNGVGGGANLATNTIPFASGDHLAGAPTSQFAQQGINLYLGQNTPSEGSTGITVFDAGPYPLRSDLQVLNSAGTTFSMMNISGSFFQTFRMDNRPTSGGSLIFNQGNGASDYYNIYEDDSAPGAMFGFDPSTGSFSFFSNGYGPLMVNGSAVCVQGGPCASGPSGVPSVNGITSAVTIAAGDGISVSNSGSTVTVANTEPLNASTLQTVLSASPFNINSADCGSGVVYAARSPSPYGLIQCDPGTQNVSPGYWLLGNGSVPGMQLNGAGSSIGLLSNQPSAFYPGLQLFGDDTYFDAGSGTEYLFNAANEITVSFIGAYGSGFFSGGLTADSGIADTALSTVGDIITIGSYGLLTDSGVLATNLIQTSTTVHGDLSGTYASPTVTAVHAVSGTIDGVTIGGTTPEPGTFGALTSSSYIGPSTTPAGSCPTNGVWVFSQDGHATFCASGTWVTKI